jgi:chromosome segregation and condensation protein ScpB
METISPTEQLSPPEPVTIPAAPRGRPWIRGQSGNPAGRPSRARQAAVVAEALIARKTVPLTMKALELALGGDRAALRLCLDRIAPARREPPIDLDLLPIKGRSDLLIALTAVADAAASGALTSSQSATLTRMLIALQQSTW